MGYRESLTDQIVRFQISRLMNNHRMTQEKMGIVLSLTPSMISRKCTGRSPYHVAELGVIANHFGCTVADLVTDAAPLPGDRPRKWVTADNEPADW